MALWGRDDNLTSAGTVSLAYDTGVVTGSGTGFADADVGKVIRFGIRGSGGTYMGDAQIIKRTSATQISIANTFGLSGVAIAGTSYYLSELPSYTTNDHAWSNKHDTVASYKTIARPKNLGTAGIGNTNIAFKYKDVGTTLAVGGPGEDSILIDGSNIKFATLGTGTAKANATSGVGSDRIYVQTSSLPNISANSAEVVAEVGSVVGKQLITNVQATYVDIGAPLTAAVNNASVVTFHSPHLVGLASTIPVALADGDDLVVQRRSGGYDKQIYGVSVATAQTYDEDSGKYRTSGSGWVGVTTYIDCDGNFRVKSEILVAMGPNKDNGNTGITTGSYGIAYPTAE